MRVLVVYFHPVETSFHAALHQEVLHNLRATGHEVDDCDLYAEGFDPVLSREERLGYHEVPGNHDRPEAFERHIRKPVDTSFDHKGVRFLLLNNSRFGETPTFRGALGKSVSLCETPSFQHLWRGPDRMRWLSPLSGWA